MPSTGDTMNERFQKPTSCTIFESENSSLGIFPAFYEGIFEGLFVYSLIILAVIGIYSGLKNLGRKALQRGEVRKMIKIFYGGQEGVGGDGFFSWLLDTHRLKIEQISSKCGEDAVVYLSFQLHLIYYTTGVAIISLLSTLPANIMGSDGAGEFGHTTMSNLDPNSSWLWLHAGLSICFFLAAIPVLRHFSVQLKISRKYSPESRTLMIHNIHCTNTQLVNYFREFYPDLEVVAIISAFKVSKLMKLEKERKMASESLNEANRGNGVLVRPFLCGICSSLRSSCFCKSCSCSCCCNCCSCCCSCCCSRCGPAESATNYYGSEETRLKAVIESEKAEAVKQPLGVVFVTFLNPNQASTVLKDHPPKIRRSNTGNRNQYQLLPVYEPSLSDTIESRSWTLNYAPHPDEIVWENLENSTSSRVWKTLLIYPLFIIGILVWATITTGVTTLNDLKFSNIHDLHPIVSQYLPGILVSMLSSFIPPMIAYFDKKIGHYTDLKNNSVVMVKSIFFSFLMGFIIPSIWLILARAYIELRLIGPNGTFRWDCVYLADNGVSFVYLVLNTSVTGTVVQLLRLSEVLTFVLQYFCAKSKAEIPTIRLKYLNPEFSYRDHYASMLYIFAIIMTCSVVSPLITPFGVVYLFLKRYVDKYTLYYVCKPTRVNKNIHSNAVLFTTSTFLLLQLNISLFSIFRYGSCTITTFLLTGLGVMCSYVLLCLVMSCDVLIIQPCLRWFRQFSTIAYVENHHADVEICDFESEPEIFLPPVLKDLFL